MNPIPDETTAGDDPRLCRAVQEYLHEVERGLHPDRRAFAARYPDLSGELIPYLEALDAVQAASPLLRKHPEGTPQPAVAEPPLGEPLGDFSLVREIGRGGMGVVYEAIQLSLGRRVALKVLPFAAALDARQLQRFKNEAQAAGHLHHTNIVPVYAVGCERGVHYYAMQLIEGDNLAVVVEALRQSAPSRDRTADSPRGANSTGPYSPEAPPFSPPSETRSLLGAQLSTQRSARSADFFRTLVGLVIQAAEALDHAHRYGVIHRDVKPGNILIDTTGHVWMTDFGLAQFRAEAGLTRTGDLVGTLRYMSPEQAGGQRVLLDHRTDIYSLGATLYELLTLRPIFDGTDQQTLLRQILIEEPKPPRALDRSIPDELEIIVLKAIAKVPSERYTTAREFADDLQRFLRNEPILARRPTLPQRVGKWLRRHPVVPAVAAVMLLVVTIAAVVTAWLLRGEQEKTQLAYEQVAAEQVRTQDALYRERQRAEEAERQFRLARRSVDELIVLAEEELLGKPQVEGVRKRLLEAALAYYQEFIELRRDDPDARAELAATQTRVKQILGDLALRQGAGQLDLLRDSAVLDDLRLSREQRGQVETVARKLDTSRGELFRDFHRLTAREREQRFIDHARANEAAVAEVLTMEQRRRLAEIALQMKGLAAFRDDEVTAPLKLTAEQKVRIQVIESEIGPPPRWGGDPRKIQEERKAYEEKLRGALKRAQTVLTEEQKQLWRGMTGEPYNGPLLMGPGGPRK